MECKNFVKLIEQESYKFEMFKSDLKFYITSPHIEVLTSHHTFKNVYDYVYYTIDVKSSNRRIKLRDENYDDCNLFKSFLEALEKQMEVNHFKHAYKEMIKFTCSRDEQWIKMNGM